MDRETNIDSIRALEEEIREHERATVELKRTRNSFLNVSKLPPEVLGNVFRWNVILRGDFGGLDKESHNFLLVCHHWLEVASRTPELWSFWGNAPKDWARWHHHSGTAPIDLVLGGFGYDEKYFDATLRNVLKDRAAKDCIRLVHLTAAGTGLVKSILKSLTSSGEEIRPIGIESFVLFNQSEAPVNVSPFFAHYRFPKLQRLNLNNCSISSWDHLTSRTSALTTLDLNLAHPSSPTPTASQLLSILSSNPSLRKVVLLKRAVPDDGDASGGEFSSRVQLHHLKELRMEGGLEYVFNILHQLDRPGNVDLILTLHDCDGVEISQIVAPYLQDHVQRRDRSQNGLNLFASSGYRTYPKPHVALCLVENAGGSDFSDQARLQVGAFVTITMMMNGKSCESRETAALDLVACIPREEVVYFKARNNPIATEDTCAQFSNVRALSFDSVPLSAAFPNPDPAGEGSIFPSLEHALLERAEDDDWSPLMTFLESRKASGNPLDTLVISDSPNMPSGVTECIKGIVRKLNVEQQNMMQRLLAGVGGPGPF